MPEVIFDIDNTALEAVRSLQITANFKEMEAALSELVEPYKNLIVTEEGIAQAKTDRAKLRKLATNIDDRRKLVKKMYSEPLTVFEDKCKQLNAVIAEGIDNLDNQVKSYEAKAKAAKINALTEYFDNLPKRHPQYMKFEDCVNPKWTNMTYPVETAQTEIENYVLKVDNDIDSILSLESKFESLLLDEYKKTADISSVLLLKKRAEDAEKEAALREAAQMEKAEREAELKRQEEAKKASVKPEPVPVEKKPSAPEYCPKAFRVITSNIAQEEELLSFCLSHQIMIQTIGG